MTSVTAPWTVTYAPGPWIALAGPATLVVIPPEFAHRASELWAAVASASDVDALAQALSRYGVAAVDRFAAFFVADGSLRSLTRGEIDLRVGGTPVEPSPDVCTWVESELGPGAVVSLQVAESDRTTRLPLLAGAALVSAITLDQSSEMRIGRATTDGQTSDDGDWTFRAAETDGWRPREAEPGSAPPWPRSALPPKQQIGLATPADTDEDRTHPRGDKPLRRGAASSRPTVVAPELQRKSSGSVTFDGTVEAAWCANHHANPPAGVRCRRCGAIVDPTTTTRVPAPVLAQLVASSGQFADVATRVLVGRAPARQPGDEDAVLMPVPSEHKDISRTHLCVEVRDWALQVTDRQSTNGTLLIPAAGGGPRPLEAGVPTPLRIGDSLDLGDGVVLHVGTPR